MVSYSSLFNSQVLTANIKAVEDEDAVSFGRPVLQAIVSQPGDLQSLVGTSQWYPADDIDIIDVMLVVGETSTSTITAVLYKNGVEIKSISLPSTNAKTERVACAETMTPTDYLTCSITAESEVSYYNEEGAGVLLYNRAVALVGVPIESNLAVYPTFECGSVAKEVDIQPISATLIYTFPNDGATTAVVQYWS
jgi:hypothetical protein